MIVSNLGYSTFYVMSTSVTLVCFKCFTILYYPFRRLGTSHYITVHDTSDSAVRFAFPWTSTSMQAPTLAIIFCSLWDSGKMVINFHMFWQDGITSLWELQITSDCIARTLFSPAMSKVQKFQQGSLCRWQ